LMEDGIESPFTAFWASTPGHSNEKHGVGKEEVIQVLYIDPQQKKKEVVLKRERAVIPLQRKKKKDWT